MTKLFKKGGKVHITQEYVDTFNKCKTILCNEPILSYPDFNKPFKLRTDASDIAIAVILSRGELGSDKPIAYASRTLSDTEQRYSTTEKKLLAVIWGTKYFRPYLFGQKFKIFTDHKPLAWLSDFKEPNARLQRWKLKLGEYNYEVVHIKGKNNANADALSRMRLDEEIHHQDDNTSISRTYDDRELDEVRNNLDDRKDDSSSNCSNNSNTNSEPNTSIPIRHDAIDTKRTQIFISKHPLRARTQCTILYTYVNYIHM